MKENEIKVAMAKAEHNKKFKKQSGLEALEYIKSCGLYATRDERKRLQFVHIKDIRLEDLNIIEKELKALEIIKNLPNKYKEGLLYILLNVLNERKITQKEYDLLKEVLL